MFLKRHSAHARGDPIHEDEEHKKKVQELREALGPLSGRAEKYCTPACLRRYLVARSWDVDKAARMLQETLRWRASYKPEEIRWPQVAAEQETGKMYRAGFTDRAGRSVVVMTPAKQNTDGHDGQVRHLVYLLENAVMSLAEGQEQMTWLVDYTGWSLRHASPPKTAKETVAILQNHYPERLAAAFLFNPPRMFSVLWKVVKYFVDPETAKKIHFVHGKDEESMKEMLEYFDLETLLVEFGGENAAVYNHEEVSKMMLEDDARTARFWGVAGDGAEQKMTRDS